MSDIMKELIVLELPNFRLRERETSDGAVSYDLQLRDRRVIADKWDHVDPNDATALYAFVRELGWMLRGGVPR